jgi:hypothetical protein
MVKNVPIPNPLFKAVHVLVRYVKVQNKMKTNSKKTKERKKNHEVINIFQIWIKENENVTGSVEVTWPVLLQSAWRQSPLLAHHFYWIRELGKASQLRDICS